MIKILYNHCKDIFFDKNEKSYTNKPVFLTFCEVVFLEKNKTCFLRFFFVKRLLGLQFRVIVILVKSVDVILHKADKTIKKSVVCHRFENFFFNF